MIHVKLFLEFFKVSCFTFGGAYGALALIRDAVMANGWLSEQRLAEMIAVSESTPGPIIVNLATYIGKDQGGFLGSLAATLGVVLPAYLVILLIAAVLKHAVDHPWVQAVLRGMKSCVVGLILGMGVYLTVGNVLPEWQPDPAAVGITVLLGIAMALWPKLRKKKLSPLTLIGISAVLGVVFYGG